MDLFGVYLQAISLHLTVGREFPEGQIVFRGGTAGLLRNFMVLERGRLRDFRRSGSGIELPKGLFSIRCGSWR